MPLALALLAGCDSFRVDKSIAPDAAAMKILPARVEQARQFQRAVYEVSTFAADKCRYRVAVEPFAAMTIAPSVRAR